MSNRRLLPPLARSAACCFLLAGALVVCSPSHARTDKLDFSLRETVHSVPVAGAGANIVVTSFRPRGDGPFPWIVLSHGTATTLQANRAINRYRPLVPVREWVRRGARACAARLWREWSVHVQTT